MKKFLTLIFLCTYSSASLNAAVEILDRIAVIVDDGVIMESQIKSTLDEVILRYDQQNIPKPDISNLKEQIIESLIIEELQLQLANRAGVRISDSELNDAITRLAKNNQMELEQFISFIQDSGDSYETVREDVRKQMIIQRIQRGKVGSEIDITEKEFETFLKTDESLIELEPELLVRQILVKTADDAEKALIRINSGDNFSVLAKEISISRNALNGGIMEWRKLVEMPDLFSTALKNKKIGYVTNALKSGAGYHILKIEDKRGPYVKYEDQWSARHILLSPSAIRNEEETIELLSNLRSRILNGEKFTDLAIEFSEDPGSSMQGGKLDWMGRGILAPEFEKVMTEIPIGEISQIFETQFGYHFLEVLDTRNHDLTRELIEDQAYQILYSRKYDQELENTLRSMRAEAFVEIKELD